MRVLVATSGTQGARASDYCWTVEGELVRLPAITCANPSCGCDRGWAGLSSSRATTTCRVADLDLDRAELVGAFTESLHRDGWLVPGDDRSWIRDFVGTHLQMAGLFPIDAVLELTGETVTSRAHTGGRRDDTTGS